MRTLAAYVIIQTGEIQQIMEDAVLPKNIEIHKLQDVLLSLSKLKDEQVKENNRNKSALENCYKSMYAREEKFKQELEDTSRYYSRILENTRNAYELEVGNLYGELMESQAKEDELEKIGSLMSLKRKLPMFIMLQQMRQYINSMKNKISIKT